MVQTAVETYHQNRQEDEETATIEADESTQASLSEDLLGSAEVRICLQDSPPISLTAFVGTTHKT